MNFIDRQALDLIMSYGSLVLEQQNCLRATTFVCSIGGLHVSSSAVVLKQRMTTRQRVLFVEFGLYGSSDAGFGSNSDNLFEFYNSGMHHFIMHFAASDKVPENISNIPLEIFSFPWRQCRFFLLRLKMCYPLVTLLYSR
jgi:hypothetical protein